MRWGRSYKGKGITYDAYPVASNFLRFMGIRITDGRDFNENDDLKPEISQIFNETSQRKDSITVGEKMEDGTNIVGIARDFNFQPLQYGINPFAFVAFGTTEWGAWTPLRYLFVKTNGTDIPAVADFIRKSVKELVPDSQLDIRFMDEEIGNQYYKEQKLSNLLTLFSLLSILISIVGVFGLVLFETQYRRKEIGIRKIHGATVGEILRMFNKILRAHRTGVFRCRRTDSLLHRRPVARKLRLQSSGRNLDLFRGAGDRAGNHRRHRTDPDVPGRHGQSRPVVEKTLIIFRTFIIIHSF